MRCVICSREQPTDCFSGRQRKRRAGERKCTPCAATADVEGNVGGGISIIYICDGDPPTPAACTSSSGATTAALKTAASPADAPAKPLRLGTQVELVGLGAAHLNGTRATVAYYMNDHGRVVVTTDKGRLLAVRAINLWVVAGAATSATGGGAPVDGAAEAGETAAETGAPAPDATTAKTCSWTACGNGLSGVAAAKNRCGRCKRAYYCSRACQKKHWKAGGHQLVCAEPPCCTICLEGGDNPLPMQRGCACRGDAGLAHAACLAQAAAHKSAGGWSDAWAVCATCGQAYTGGMRIGMARDLVRRMEALAVEDHQHHLLALENLGQALCNAGENAEAHALLCSSLALRRRMFGRGHPSTRRTASFLAGVLERQGHHAAAARLYQENLAATPAKEQEDPITLADKSALAKTLSCLGDHEEAEALLRSVTATRDRLLGPNDASALHSTSLLADLLQYQGRHAEAEAIFRPTLLAQQRVFGPGHPNTICTGYNLACSLTKQGQHAEAEPLLRSALEGRRHTLGQRHPDTLLTARVLASTLDALGNHAEAEVVRRESTEA